MKYPGTIIPNTVNSHPERKAPYSGFSLIANYLLCVEEIRYEVLCEYSEILRIKVSGCAAAPHIEE